jgi:hypothetical protein
MTMDRFLVACTWASCPSRDYEDNTDSEKMELNICGHFSKDLAGYNIGHVKQFLKNTCSAY